MEIEESDVKVVSIDEKIAEVVVEKVDDSTVPEIKREAWKSDRVDSTTTETDASANASGNRANAATTATGANRASSGLSAKVAEIDKDHVTSTVTVNAMIDRELDNTMTIGVLASIDRETIDADAMMMIVAIDAEVDAVLGADMTIALT